MGDMPAELRLTGGAARSRALRSTLSAAVNAPVRVSSREEAGAAGAAMMAAVAIGAYKTMDDCIAEWVAPLLGATEAPDEVQAKRYEELFTAYKDARLALEPIWDKLAADR
jgi:erythritol kinase